LYFGLPTIRRYAARRCVLELAAVLPIPQPPIGFTAPEPHLRPVTNYEPPGGAKFTQWLAMGFVALIAVLVALKFFTTGFY